MTNIVKGWLGEKVTTLGMWAMLDKNVYRLVDNVIVNTPSGTTQIDHVLVSVYGIFVKTLLRKLKLTYQSFSGVIVNEKVTVKDNVGKTTVDVEDAKDTKVGDMDKIIGRIIEKLTEKPGKSEKP